MIEGTPRKKGFSMFFLLILVLNLSGWLTNVHAVSVCLKKKNKAGHGDTRL